MKQEVLFIHGGGENGYEADKKLAASLEQLLGDNYKVNYPKMDADESRPDFGWPQQIGRKIEAAEGNIILVGHSLGASMLLKYLTENEIKKRIKGIFLIAAPFWHGDEDWVQGLKLKDDFAESMPQDTPVYFYHCVDDKEIPISNFSLYREILTSAEFCEIEEGGHQLGNDLSKPAEDIKSL